MKIILLLGLVSYVLGSAFSSTSLGGALNENGSIYGWKEEE